MPDLSCSNQPGDLSGIEQLRDQINKLPCPKGAWQGNTTPSALVLAPSTTVVYLLLANVRHTIA